MPSPIVGRFAPTPSGRLHLGNLLCAMLAYLSARSAGGKFLLRIEDLDIPRCPAALSRQAVEDLAYLGFTWDEEPLYQSQRASIYDHALEALARQGLLYPCFCTRAQLHASAAPNLGDTQFIYAGTCRNLTQKEISTLSALRKPALRLRVADKEISFQDGVYGLYTENLALDCGDFIVKRSDGLFGYQLAVVVDDALSGVSQVVRGRDILSATPRQIYLQKALGFPQPDYFHIPLLLDSDGRRLAKRDRDLGLDALLRWMSPGELLGMLAFSAGLLSEARPTTLEKLIPLFSWDKVRREDIRLPKDFTQTARTMRG